MCQGNILRRTLRQNKVQGNTVLTDIDILVRSGCAPVRVRLAQQRLLMAARLARHGPTFIVDEVRREAQELPTGWWAGLQEDLTWLGSAMDLSTWGSTVHEVWHWWQVGRPGWKRIVKQAGRSMFSCCPN